MQALAESAHVLIDFTLPGPTVLIAEAATNAGVPLVCGVSGLDDASLDALAAAAATVPVFYDRNMSIGVAVLQQLVGVAAPVLADGYRTQIHETHHVHKVDAPSGTALKLGEAIAASRGKSLQDLARYEDDPVSPGDIQFDVTRRGEVPGDHAVVFEGTNEVLELRHSVSDRRVFADGALKAARWLSSRSPGLYSMRNMVLDSGA